jgi:hypothetical protein
MKRYFSRYANIVFPIIAAVILIIEGKYGYAIFPALCAFQQIHINMANDHCDIVGELLITLITENKKLMAILNRKNND